jgi:lysophospholipase L1-like esterase
MAIPGLKTNAGPLPPGATPANVISAEDFNWLIQSLTEVVSIKNYGAVCDGVTDDSVPLSNLVAALNSSSKTVVVPGRCLINSNITIPPNLPIRFEGNGSFVGAGTVSYLLWANAAPIGVHFPFTTKGAFPTGSLMGTKGEALTLARSTVGTYIDANGARQTAAINALRVESLGALLEWTRTQLHPSPTSPTSGTVTFAALGTYIFWVEGSGSQTLTASGTLVATGLPCTATAASPGVFTVTSLGATPTATLGGAVGLLTAAQIELGSSRTSLISALGARSQDVPTIVNPLQNGDLNWCVLMDFTPDGGGAWTPPEYAAGRFFTCGTPGGANTFLATRGWLGGSTPALVFSVFDAAGNALTWAVRSWLLPGTTHRLAFCNAAGRLSIYIDGIKYLDTYIAGVSSGSSGTGSGIIGTMPSTITPCCDGSNGYVKNFKVYRTADPFSVGYAPAVLDFKKVACFGDSLTFGTGGTPYPTQLGTMLGANWLVDNFGEGGAQLLNLKISPWQNGSYVGPGINNNDKLYGWLCFLAGINDINNAAATADQLYAWATGVWNEAREGGRRVIPITLLPYNNNGLWTSGKEAVRVDFNARLKAWFNARGLPYVDAATALDDGTGKLQTIYDSGDHLHLSTAGYALVASMVQTAILAYP